MFKNRNHAGKLLAKNLEKYKNTDNIVLAVPNGGIPVATEVAKHLNLNLSLVFSLKLPYPDDDNTTFGAVSENGNTYVHSYAELWLSESQIHEIIDRKKHEIKDKINILRNDMPLPKIKNKNVIIIDDGISKGATIFSIIKLCRSFQVRKIIIGSPISSREISDLIARKVDKLIVLEKPLTFNSISQCYDDWQKLSESEVIKILEQFYLERGMILNQKKEVA
jgi:predicted phosphoribosyltransferase